MTVPGPLDSRRVLVVGGTSGIGLATARHAVALGAAEVVVASRSEAKVSAAAAALGRRAIGRVLDATDDAAVEAFFSGDREYDHIVVSAADLKAGAVRALSLSDAYRAMDSKFWGAYRVARAAAFAAGGSLTLVSGVLSRRPVRGAALLGAVNAAIEALTQGLALELAPVRVNTVSPGRTDTPWWASLGEDERRAMLDRTAAALPVGRVGRPEDIAQQIGVFMTNPFMTGSIVYLDGGAAIA